MTGTLYLFFGTVLLVLVISDFFYTTLSRSGGGMLSRFVSLISHKVIQLIVRWFGRGMYNYSGLIVNLLILLVWIITVWYGLYLVYSSDPEAIVNNNGRMANSAERLYFTGYVLSTLGLGNFQAVTASFEILTSAFSFFGFIFFTSSMTYLISVGSALINKRVLSRTIQNLGTSPEIISEKILELDRAFSYQQILSLQNMIETHSVNHRAYPVLHFYSHPEPEICLSLNITRLDEAVSILLASEKGSEIRNELASLHDTLSHFLNHMNKKYSRILPKSEESLDSLPVPYKIRGADNEKLGKRREILRKLLKSESFDWEDVSPAKSSKG